MSSYQNVFELVSEEFKKEKIPCILIGGFVVNHYKFVRMTDDVDFMIKESDFEKSKDLLIKAGYKLSYLQDVFARFMGDKARFLDLDLMFVDQETLDRITKDGQTISIQGKEFVVPSLHHLIALKLHAIKGSKWREMKDLLDVVSLMRINRVDVKSDNFKNLCARYGPKDIYKKISEFMRDS